MTDADRNRTATGGPSGSAPSPPGDQSGDHSGEHSGDRSGAQSAEERRIAAHRGKWITPPNVVSLIRIGMAPLVGWLIVMDQPVWAFWVFLFAGISDGVDGALARWLNMRSDLGSILDPMGDKALLVISFVALGFQGSIPLWLVVLVIVRDTCLVLATGLIYLRARGAHSVSPSWISKMNTVFQIMLAASTLAALAFEISFGPATIVLIWATAVTTTVSGLGYLIRLVRSSDANRGLA